MDRVKIHPLILLSLLINVIAMGMFAYENYNENNLGYTGKFIVLTIYGLVRNSKINSIRK